MFLLLQKDFSYIIVLFSSFFISSRNKLFVIFCIVQYYLYQFHEFFNILFLHVSTLTFVFFSVVMYSFLISSTCLPTSCDCSSFSSFNCSSSFTFSSSFVLNVRLVLVCFSNFVAFLLLYIDLVVPFFFFVLFSFFVAPIFLLKGFNTILVLVFLVLVVIVHPLFRLQEWSYHISHKTIGLFC